MSCEPLVIVGAGLGAALKASQYVLAKLGIDPEWQDGEGPRHLPAA